VYSTRYSQKILNRIELPRQIFEKFSNIKFHENPSSGSRVVLYGVTDERRSVMTKSRVAFQTFAKAHKKAGKRRSS